MIIIFLLLILACFLSFVRLPRTAMLFLLLAVSGFWLIGSGMVVLLLLKDLETYKTLSSFPWQQSNAIVILGGGTVKTPDQVVKPTVFSYSRIQEGARLYNACKKKNHICKIIVSGADVLRTGKTEADVYQHELESLNIPAKDIITEPYSMNTFKNAEYTLALIKEHRLSHVFLVTSGIHLKRAMLYFTYFGMVPTPAPADHLVPYVTFIPLGYNFAITDFVLHEYAGILRFYLYNMIGWNPKISNIPGEP